LFIVGYCLIIYNFADKLNFKVPQKILDYEDKIKTKEISNHPLHLHVSHHDITEILLKVTFKHHKVNLEEEKTVQILFSKQK
jgi:hypothetical protein